MDPWRPHARQSNLDPSLPPFMPGSPSSSQKEPQNHPNAAPVLPMNHAFYQDIDGQFYTGPPQPWMAQPQFTPAYYQAPSSTIQQTPALAPNNGSRSYPSCSNSDETIQNITWEPARSFGTQASLSSPPRPSPDLNGDFDNAFNLPNSFGDANSLTNMPTGHILQQQPTNPNVFEHPTPGYGQHAPSQHGEADGYGSGGLYDSWMFTLVRQDMQRREERRTFGYGLAGEEHQYDGSQDTVDRAFAGTHHRYNPTARPFTPTNGSSIPSERPLPKNAMTGPSPPWAFSPSGVLGGREDDSQDRVDQNPPTEPLTFLSNSPAPSGPHLAGPTFPVPSPPQTRPVAQPAQRRRGRPSKTAAAQDTGSTTQQPPIIPSNKTTKKWVIKQTSKYDEIRALIPQMQSAVKLLKDRNDTDLLPDPPNRLPSGLFFRNATDAASANLIRFWQPPLNDTTIPTTQGEEESWVQRLVNAMFNEDGYLKTNEEQDSKSHVNRWSQGAVFYRKTAIEATAWRLVQLGKDIHQHGWNTPIAEPKTRDDIYYSMHFTFGERMHMVERVLELQKHTCDDLIKGNRFPEIVGCPQVVFERLYSNHKANQEKRRQLAMIKKSKEIASDSKTSMETAHGTDAQGSSDGAMKRKRGDDAEEVVDSSQPKTRTSKKMKSFADPSLEESDGEASSEETVPAEDSDTSDETEDLLSVPPNRPAMKAPTSSASSTRPVKAAKGAASAATTKKHNSGVSQPDAECTSGKKRNKRAVEEAESDDEFPVASKKKARRSVGHTATEQPASSRATRRVATKTPKGAQSGSRPARPHGGA